MAYVQADRVQETTTTTGPGTLTLGGAVAGYRTFGSQMANGDTCYYLIVDPATSAWETGIGTWSTGGSLARTTLLDSSTGSAISFAAGTKNVMMTQPAKGTPIMPASTSGQPSAVITPGVAPTTPANGHVWLTSAGLYIVAGGDVFGPLVGMNNSNGNLLLPATAGIYLGNANLQQIILATGAGNHSIEIGRQDGTASTPYVDFHSGSTVVDYDVRALASGGSGSNGGADLTLYLANLILNGTLKPLAGTTSKAPVSFDAGSVKRTSPLTGDFEFDGDTLSITGANNGRQIQVAAQRYRLPSGASTIATGTDFFPSKRPWLEAGRLYRFWFLLAFVKNTAGTVTFQLKNSAGVNFTSISATMVLTQAATSLAAVGNVVNANAAAATTATFPATASLTASAGYIAIVQGLVIPASDTRLSVTPSAYGAGTITTSAGSVEVVEDLGPNGDEFGNLG